LQHQHFFAAAGIFLPVSLGLALRAALFIAFFLLAAEHKNGAV